MAHGFKVLLVYEHEYEDCGESTEQDIIAEYPIDEVKSGKVKFLPPTNLLKRDLLAYVNKGDA